MSGFIGNISSFDPRSQEWSIFMSRLQQFLVLNNISDGPQKRALLLTHLSDEAYKLLTNLAHPKSVETLEYSELIRILKNHFTPRRSSFADKDAFYSAVQGNQETVEDWAARLRGLAVYCDLGTALDTVLRDRFVLGLRVGPERDRLFELEASTLTLARAIEVAQQAACARKARADAASTISRVAGVEVKPEPIYRVSAHQSGEKRDLAKGCGSVMFRACKVCGLKNHETEKCRYKHYKCKKCNEKGHLKKVCKYGGKSLHNIKVKSTDTNSEGSDCEECNLFNLRCVNNNPILIPVVLNDSIFLNMELDTGSSTSVISNCMYEKFFSKCPLNKCQLKLCFYNGHKIAPMGYINIKIKYKKVEHLLSLYIIQNGGPPLLGRDFMTKFKISLTSELNKIDFENNNNSNLQMLLNNFSDLFVDELGCFNKYKISFHLKKGVTPKFCKARPLPFAIKDKVENEIQRLVDKGILVATNWSPWASAIVPVLKKDGTVRICGDYSMTVNKVMHIDKYPMPRIEEVFAKLAGGELYSKIDCSQAYAQFVLSTESQKLTTINTSKGLFMYTRLVYGLANAPAIFQRAIENLLVGIDGVSVWLDDVCVTAPTTGEHLNRLRLVFQRFKDAGLKLKKNKCEFFKKRVTYLGHVIDRYGLHKCPQKVEAIVQAPQPSSVTELKRFLGMVNYYRNFVPQAASILAPLNSLLRENIQWEWGKEQQLAFKNIKNELCSERILAHFDPSASLVLTVDASPFGLAAVLSQIGKDKIEKPLAFASRSLSKSEQNYSQLHKEATAIIFGIKKFHQYVYGRQDPFLLKTDHRPLLAIFGENKGISVMTASRLVRYAIFLSAYNYRIQYISSKNNQVADYFSRSPVVEDAEELTEKNNYNCYCVSVNALQLHNLPVTHKGIKNATVNDKTLITICKYIKNGWPKRVRCSKVLPYFRCRNELQLENGCLLRGHRVIIPSCYRDTMLKELHNSHLGIVKTKSMARMRMWWPNIDREIEQLIAACGTCSALRAAPPRATPSPWPRPSQPWDRVHIDYMSIRQKVYLVVVDAFSKWLECIEMNAGTHTRQLIIKLNTLFSTFGLPRTIVSDNDVKISSQEFMQYCAMNGINYITSPIYHPCSNGQAENSVRTCKKFIKTILESSTSRVQEQLPDILFEYRNTVHCTTRHTPAKLMFGRNLRGRLDLILPPPEVHQVKNLTANMFEKCRHFKVGQEVWTVYYENKHQFWIKGTISGILGRRMYLVNLSSKNITCKRHIDQILRYTNNNECQTRDVVSTSEQYYDQSPYLPTSNTDPVVTEGPDHCRGTARSEGDEVWEDAVTRDTDNVTVPELVVETPTGEPDPDLATEEVETQPEQPYSLRLRPRNRIKKKTNYKIL